MGKNEKRLSFVLMAIGILSAAIFFFASCATPPAGCKNRAKNKASKKWAKGMRACPEEMARQSLIAFPFKTTDSFRQTMKPGEQKVKSDTQITYTVKQGNLGKPEDCIPDTVLKEVKVIIDNSRVDTIVQQSIQSKADQRELILSNAEKDRLKFSLLEAKKKVAKLEAKVDDLNDSNRLKKWWLIAIISGVIAYFGIKFGLAKLKAAKSII